MKSTINSLPPSPIKNHQSTIAPALIETILGTSVEGAVLYRVHRKNGQTFALIPANRRLQARLAPLLPAQSWKARLYRQAVQWTGLSGVSFPSEETRVPFPADSPLVSLLRKVSQSQTPPMLLPGNPAGATPRLVFICLNSEGQPVGVIKAGATDAARGLIRYEHAVLQQINRRPEACNAPRPFDLVETAKVSAFGMEFVSGRSPRWPAKESILEKSLTPWIDDSRVISMAESPLWKQFTTWQEENFQHLSISAFQHFSSTLIHPALFHGDFAPWNVREQAQGTWTAIDWERGEHDGLPGWDWLHYIIQPAILVRRWPVERVLVQARTAIQSRAFQRYLTKAFPGSVPANAGELLLRSYLLYNWHVLRPTERSAAHEALAALAMRGPIGN